MSQPPPRSDETDEPSARPAGKRAADTARALTVRASRAVAARVETMFTTGGMGFRDLAIAHAASTAGDTLVAIALAGTLFFSVPSSEARGNVALYLLLTVAPFAIIGPLLGRLLDRTPTAYRLTLVWSAILRVVLALALAWQQDTVWLFPAAFGLLVLSRVHGISRNAMLPAALDRRHALVAANSRLAQVGVLSGAVIVPFGALGVWLGGATAALIMSGLAFVVAALSARLLPSPPGTTERERQQHRRVRLRIPRHVRLAQLATAVVRVLNGFLVLLLAFAFRDVDAPLADFGAVLGAAGGGFALASVVSPHLESRLREEPMVVAALAVEAAAAFVAGQWFGLPEAAFLAASAGFAWGTAKLAFDGLLQSSLEPHRRGQAFTRSETVFQIAWVLGAVVPTALLIPVELGLIIAGLTALSAQVVYVANLLAPLRAARMDATDEAATDQPTDPYEEPLRPPRFG